MPSSGSANASGSSATPSSILALSPTNDSIQLIVADVRQITHTERGILNWQVLSAAISITAPDGTFTTPPIAAISNAPALTQKLYAQFNPTIAGVYRIEWEFVASDNETYNRVEYWLVNWTDVSTLTRTLLQKSASTLPYYDVATQFSILNKLLHLAYPTLPPYSALVGDDQMLYDTGMSYLAAARIQNYKPSTVPRGAVTSIKEQTSQWSFSVPAAMPHSELDGLTAGTLVQEGIKLLRAVSSIKAIYDNIRTGNNALHIMVLDGPSRNSLRRGYQPTFYSVVANMLSTSVDLGGTFDWPYWSAW